MRSVLAAEALGCAREWGCCSSTLCREGRWRSVHCSFSIIPFSIPTHGSSKASHQDRWVHSDRKTCSLVNTQLSTRQKSHLWRLKKPNSPGETGRVGLSEATHQRVTPEKLMAALRVNSDAADANTSVLAVRYLSRLYTAKTAALI